MSKTIFEYILLNEKPDSNAKHNYQVFYNEAAGTNHLAVKCTGGGAKRKIPENVVFSGTLLDTSVHTGFHRRETNKKRAATTPDFGCRHCLLGS